ncbi:hypothetical protein TNCV_4964321 [Trichonephila clavipes]|nr:hypothetical protein TNCV_4964321 [Trichonephila clavipes]
MGAVQCSGNDITELPKDQADEDLPYKRSRCTLNLSRLGCPHIGVGRSKDKEVPAQVSLSSLDHGSKLKGPSPIIIVQLCSVMLT